MDGIASRAASSSSESWTLAAERTIASGMPVRSTTRWRLLPALPRSVGFGPVAAPPFGGDTRRVQRCPRPVKLVRIRRALEQYVMQSLPYPSLLPIAQSSPARHPAATAQLLRKQLPADATLEHKNDATQYLAVIQAWAPTLGLGRRRRNERRDNCPQSVTDQHRVHRIFLFYT